MTYPDVWAALLPPAVFIGFHLVEANFFTPMVVGHRLTISPLSILFRCRFWAWVWGTTGALAGGAAADHPEDRSSPPPARPTSPVFCSSTGR